MKLLSETINITSQLYDTPNLFESSISTSTKIRDMSIANVPRDWISDSCVLCAVCTLERHFYKIKIGHGNTKVKNKSIKSYSILKLQLQKEVKKSEMVLQN